MALAHATQVMSRFNYAKCGVLAIVFNGDYSIWVTIHLHNEVATQVLSVFILHTLQKGTDRESLATTHAPSVSC